MYILRTTLYATLLVLVSCSTPSTSINKKTEEIKVTDLSKFVDTVTKVIIDTVGLTEV
jgi:hypothetical protein